MNSSADKRLQQTLYLYEKVKESKIIVESPEPQYGEIFIANKESSGTLQLIPESKGKQIINISGGKKKVFLFEEVGEEEHVVTAIHPESEDYIEYNGQITLSIDEIVQSLEGYKIA